MQENAPIEQLTFKCSNPECGEEFKVNRAPGSVMKCAKCESPANYKFTMYFCAVCRAAKEKVPVGWFKHTVVIQEWKPIEKIDLRQIFGLVVDPVDAMKYGQGSGAPNEGGFQLIYTRDFYCCSGECQAVYFEDMAAKARTKEAML